VPVTKAETDDILRIAREFVPPAVLRRLLHRLYDEVGSRTPNESLRRSLQMLRDAAGFEPNVAVTEDDGSPD